MAEGAPPDPAQLAAMFNAHLGGFETERMGNEADHPLYHERAVRAAGAAVRADRNLVRIGDLEFHGVVPQAVGPGKLAGGDDRDDHAVRRVGAAVVDKMIAQGEDPTASSTSWIWPRSWLAAVRCSRRSSVHLTGRPRRIAAQGTRTSSG